MGMERGQGSKNATDAGTALRLVRPTAVEFVGGLSIASEIYLVDIKHLIIDLVVDSVALGKRRTLQNRVSVNAKKDAPRGHLEQNDMARL